MISATVITDASFCHETRAAGWAAHVQVDTMSGPVRMSAAFRDTPANSAEAELLAAVNGLWLATQRGAEQFLLQTDCLAVVTIVNGRSRKGLLRFRFAAACEAVGIDPMIVTARHVRGHSGVLDARSHVNRWCDRHAKTAMRHQRKQFIKLKLGEEVQL